MAGAEAVAEKEREQLVIHQNRSNCSPSIEKDHLASTSKSSNGELSQEESESHLKTEDVSLKHSSNENIPEKLKNNYGYNFTSDPNKNKVQIGQQQSKNDIKIQ